MAGTRAVTGSGRSDPAGRARGPLATAAMVLGASAAAQLAVGLQGGEPIAAGWLLAYAALATLLVLVLDTDGTPSRLHDVRVVLSATALAALVVLMLRVQVRLDLAGAIETTRQWAFVAGWLLAVRAGLGGRGAAGDEGPDEAALAAAFDRVAARELARARRHERPLTLVALGLAGPPSLDPEAKARDRRALLGALAGSVRVTDAVGPWGGHVHVLLSESGPESAGRLVARLEGELEPELWRRVRVGQASFPDEEVTLVGLRERADERLRAARGRRRRADAAVCGGEAAA
jgi:hypothetical protein